MLPSSRSSTRKNRPGESNSQRQVQVDAFNELLAIQLSRNNKLRRVDTKAILEKFHKKKLISVTRQNLEYRIRLYDQGITKLLSDSVPTIAIAPVTTTNVGIDDVSSLSSLNNNNLTPVEEEAVGTAEEEE
jgi:hypothetical protein